jgi:twitching motility protein PilT
VFEALPTRDVVRMLRAAAWTTEQEMAYFVSAAGVLPAAEIAKCLAVVSHETSRAETVLHPRRLWVFAALAERTVDPSLFAPYAQALRANDPQLRAILIRLLPRVNNVQAHAELCKLMGSNDPNIRDAAAEVLGQVGGKAAFEAFVQLVQDPAFGGRMDALNIMVPKARSQSVPLIEAVLRAGKPFERYHALSLLADTRFIPAGTEEARSLAAALCQDDDERVVLMALQALAQHCQEDEFLDATWELVRSDKLALVKAVIEALRAYSSPRTAAVLSEKLREGPNPIRISVIDAAEAIGTATVIPVLVEALTHDQVGVQGHALEALSRVAKSGKVDPAQTVLWLLRNRDKSLRRLAVEMVNRIGDPSGELAPQLLKYLRDEDWWVRERTMDALVEMSWPGLTRHILKYLRDPSDIVRRFATNALKRIGDPSAVPELLKIAATDPDWWVREEAVAAAAASKDERVAPYLLKLIEMHGDLRLTCIEGLRTLGAANTVADVAALTEDIDPDVRAAAIGFVADFGGREYAAAVDRCYDDESLRVRKAARELLEKWAVREAVSTQRDRVALDDLLAMMAAFDADDLLLLAERQPYIKRQGRMEPLPGTKPIRDEALRKLVEPCLSPVQRADFDAGKDVDLSYTQKGQALRFRVNVFVQSTGIGAIFRVVKNDALLTVLDNLGLPPVVATFADLRDGLVLVGGPTGAGKSTTLAAIVDRINRTSARHVLTIEDPIETVHLCDQSLVTQREIGSHTPDFRSALRAAMREDPDVILVGEMRDLETMAFAITAAETGHLVLATIHTASAETSIARMVNMFPPGQQPQVRTMLAASLRAVVCQNLLRRKDAEGRLVVAEVLLNNDAIAALIRKGKEHQIPSMMLTAKGQGMQLMDHELARLVKENVIAFEEGFARANDKGLFEQLAAGKTVSRTESRVPDAPPSVPGRAPAPTPSGVTLAIQPPTSQPGAAGPGSRQRG